MTKNVISQRKDLHDDQSGEELRNRQFQLQIKEENQGPSEEVDKNPSAVANNFLAFDRLAQQAKVELSVLIFLQLKGRTVGVMGLIDSQNVGILILGCALVYYLRSGLGDDVVA